MRHYTERRTPLQLAAKKVALLTCLTAAAANGKVCPSISQFANLLGVNQNAIYELFKALREDKVIDWFLVYCGTGLGKVRVVTIKATGHTTARPAMAKRATGSLKQVKSGSPELENAKTALRRCGRVVFNAEVTDGPRGRGFIKVDGRDLKPAEVLSLAHRAGAI